MPHGKVAWKRGVEIAAWPAKNEERFGVCRHACGYVYACISLLSVCLSVCMYVCMYVCKYVCT